MHRLTRRTAALILAALSLTACGGDGGTDPDPGGGTPAITVATSASSLALEQGASGTVNVSIARSGGFTGPVTLAIEGAPTGVTATAAPNPVTSDAATLTIATTGSAPVGSHALTVRATGAGVAAKTAPLTLTVAAAFVGQRGTIAYVRDQKEIRLVEPDGSNDRLLWAHPRPDIAENLGIVDLAWRPDGRELAFASQHEATHSLFESDLYAIRPNGSGLRRLTNPPAVAELAGFAKGTVRVTVHNDAGNILNPDASGFFIVYVVGAAEPQTTTVTPGNSTTLVFGDVADLGDATQPVVAMNGEYRWFNPGVNVRAGATVDAPTLEILNAVRGLGAMSPFWRQDGSRIGYRSLSGCAGLWAIAPTGAPGLGIGSMIAGGNEMLACQGTWGPTAATADQVLHTGPTDDNSVYRVHENGSGRVRLFQSADWVPGAVWLPDASGFIYLKADQFLNNINLFRFEFASGQSTPVTSFTNEFVRSFAIASDGQHVVYERADRLFEYVFDPPAQTALWIVGIDGGGARLLVENAENPAW